MSYMHKIYFDHIQSLSQHLTCSRFNPQSLSHSPFSYTISLKDVFKMMWKWVQMTVELRKGMFHHPGSWSTGCCQTRNMGACHRTWILCTPREILVFNCLTAKPFLQQLCSSICYHVHLWCRNTGWHGWPIKDYTLANTDCSSEYVFEYTWMMILRMKVCDNFQKRHMG